MAKTLETLIDAFFSKTDHWKITLIKNWPSIAGKLHEHVSIEKITDTMIILTVSNSCLMQELYHLSDLLLEKINQTLDQPRIKNVRFKLKSEKKKRTKTKIPHRKKRTSEPTLQKSDITSLRVIKDPELKAALKNFRLRCYRE